jgi:glycosyltransferase involved in cell wall biosynthesis
MSVSRLLRLLVRIPYQVCNLLYMLYLAIWFLNYGYQRIGQRRLVQEGRRKVTMLSYVAVAYDGRIRRAATTLAAAGYDVLVIKPGDADKTDDANLKWGDRVHFISTGFSGTKTYFPYCFDRRMFQAALVSKADIYHCHDVNTSLIGLFAAAKNKAVIVCDMHEWLSETGSWNNPGDKFLRLGILKRMIFRVIERLVLRHATAVVTVSSTLAEALCRTLGVSRDIAIIRNAPVAGEIRLNNADLRSELGIEKDHFLLVYVGALGPHRNIEQVIEALSFTPKVALAVRGIGHDIYGPKWRQLARRKGVEGRVFFLPPVPPQEVVASCHGADAGVYNVADLCLSFHYALGNKIFEYVAAGLPVLAGRYPETVREVEGKQLGLVFDADDPVSIAEVINRMVLNSQLRNLLQENVLRAREELVKNAEWNKLLALYQSIA